MNWKNLENETELENLVSFSYTKPQVIFKHSTRCSISTIAKNRIDKVDSTDIDFNYLDLIAHRSLSNLIAQKFNVHHESPQVLLIKNGEFIFDESHNSIYFQEIVEALN